MVGCHHQLNGHEFKQALRDGEGQGTSVCCSPWGCKEGNTTQRLNNNKKPCMGASQVVLVVKNWPVNAEDPWVRKILEEGMTTHSSIFAWRIPWTEEPGGLQSTGSQRVRHDLATKQQSSKCFYLSYLINQIKSSSRGQQNHF